MISPVRLVYISSRTEQNLKPNTLNKNTIYTSLCVYILSLSILHCRWFTLMTNLAPVDSFEVISNKKIFDYRFVSWPKAEIKHRENVLITTRWYIYILHRNLDIVTCPIYLKYIAQEGHLQSSMSSELREIF